LGVAQLDMSSNSTSTLTASIKTFQSDIKQDVAAAYAHALVSAYRYRRYNGCLAIVNAGGCIWTRLLQPGVQHGKFWEMAKNHGASAASTRASTEGRSAGAGRWKGVLPCLHGCKQREPGWVCLSVCNNSRLKDQNTAECFLGSR
jgi:hypothetical protein